MYESIAERDKEGRRGRKRSASSRYRSETHDLID